MNTQFIYISNFMNIGIIASSNGSTFKALYQVLVKIAPNKYNFFIVLDRQSTLVEFCERYNIEYIFNKEINNKKFCRNTDNYFSKNNIKIVVLFFLRLVTEEIFKNYYTINLHPSLLPLYKGFNAIQRAYDDKSKYIGATLHKVDKNADEGKVLLQYSNLMEDNNLEKLHKISYMQKILLLFIFFDNLENKKFNFDANNKIIVKNNSLSFSTESFLKEFKKIEIKEMCKII